MSGFGKVCKDGFYLRSYLIFSKHLCTYWTWWSCLWCLSLRQKMKFITSMGCNGTDGKQLPHCSWPLSEYSGRHIWVQPQRQVCIFHHDSNTSTCYTAIKYLTYEHLRNIYQASILRGTLQYRHFTKLKCSSIFTKLRCVTLGSASLQW